MFKRAVRLGMVVIVCGFTAALAAEPLPFAQANTRARTAGGNAIDRLIGSWVMDRSKSTFTGAVPAWRNIKFEKAPAGFRHVTETRQGDAIRTVQYTFLVDEKDHPADVQMAVNTVSFKQVDAGTIERTGKYQGQFLETVTYQVSVDGKVLTVTQNVIANNTLSAQHFDRQP